MTRIDSVRTLTILTLGLAAILIATPSAAQNQEALAAASPTPMAYEELPSETPATFEPVTETFDHIRREAMIPMRDGVKLFTVILVPKGAADAPIRLNLSLSARFQKSLHALMNESALRAASCIGVPFHAFWSPASISS